MEGMRASHEANQNYDDLDIFGEESAWWANDRPMSIGWKTLDIASGGPAGYWQAPRLGAAASHRVPRPPARPGAIDNPPRGRDPWPSRAIAAM
jgi:hypothetical protein